jgi:hypothetical protein
MKNFLLNHFRNDRAGVIGCGVILLVTCGFYSHFIYANILNPPVTLPRRARVTFQMYVRHFYGNDATIEITELQMADEDASPYQVRCAITEPIDDKTYWTITRIGELRWDIYESSADEFRELGCDP